MSYTNPHLLHRYDTSNYYNMRSEWVCYYRTARAYDNNKELTSITRTNSLSGFQTEQQRRQSTLSRGQSMEQNAATIKHQSPVITDSKETRNEIFDFLFYNQRPWLDYIVSASGPIETSQCSPSGRRDMRLSPQWPRPFTFDLKTVPSVILLRLAISPLNFNFVKVLYVFELTDDVYNA